MRKGTVSVVSGFVLGLVFAVCVNAEDVGKALMQKKWREAFVTVNRQVMPVEAMEGTTLGLMEQRGFAFFEDGEAATVRAWFTFEGQGRSCKYKGYLLYSFRDGSTQVASFDGHGDPVGKQQGAFTYLKGTGRFKGIQGGGTFTAEGFPPEADLYVDAEAQYTIRER